MPHDIFYTASVSQKSFYRASYLTTGQARTLINLFLKNDFTIFEQAMVVSGQTDRLPLGINFKDNLIK